MDVVIGTYSGGQFGFAPIVIREGLKVTRVDIKCDLSQWDGKENGRTANEYGGWLAKLVRNYLLKQGRRVQTGKDSGYEAGYGEVITHRVGARGSEWQLRIYTKITPTKEQVLRIEWQLRKDLGRSIWEHISPNIYDQRLLLEAFQGVENLVLTPGLLQIPYDKTDFLPVREKDTEQSDRERWIRTQVLSACLKEFKETGKNLPELLLADFNKHFETLAANNEVYNKITERVIAANRLFSE
jgi:hypothetical protein